MNCSYSGYRQESHATAAGHRAIGSVYAGRPSRDNQRVEAVNAYLATILTALLFMMFLTIYLVVSQPQVPFRHGVEKEVGPRTAFALSVSVSSNVSHFDSHDQEQRELL
jgi:hypothetical protein